VLPSVQPTPQKLFRQEFDCEGKSPEYEISCEPAGIHAQMPQHLSRFVKARSYGCQLLTAPRNLPGTAMVNITHYAQGITVGDKI